MTPSQRRLFLRLLTEEHNPLHRRALIVSAMRRIGMSLRDVAARHGVTVQAASQALLGRFVTTRRNSNADRIRRCVADLLGANVWELWPHLYSPESRPPRALTLQNSIKNDGKPSKAGDGPGVPGPGA